MPRYKIAENSRSGHLLELLVGGGVIWVLQDMVSRAVVLAGRWIHFILRGLYFSFARVEREKERTG